MADLIDPSEREKLTAHEHNVEVTDALRERSLRGLGRTK